MFSIHLYFIICVIKRLKTKNYRSLEDLDIEFNSYYNALSGKNNSGKSNIIRALLAFLSYDYRIPRDFHYGGINYASDYPYWKKKDKDKEDILVEIDVELDETSDAGLFKFIKELIFTNEEEFKTSKQILKIKASQEADQKDTNITVIFSDHEITDDYKRDELLNRLRSSRSVLFHNSTENEPFYFTKSRRDTLISYLGREDKVDIEKRKKLLRML